jgi:hypothetical protein
MFVMLRQGRDKGVTGPVTQEVCLHPVVAMQHDGITLVTALRQLSASQAAALATYLVKWLSKFQGGWRSPDFHGSSPNLRLLLLLFNFSTQHLGGNNKTAAAMAAIMIPSGAQ